MTTERFRYDSALEKVYDDTYNGETTESYGVFECCEIMNEQHEEIEELKSDVYDWKASAEDYLKLGKSLKKENEQLKTKNNAYIQDIEVFKEENTHLKLENKQLKMETEELNEDAMSYQTLYEQQLDKFEKLLSECKHQQEQKMKFYKENKELKSFIKKLTSNDGKIWLMNGYVYKTDKILKGDVE